MNWADHSSDSGRKTGTDRGFPLFLLRYAIGPPCPSWWLSIYCFWQKFWDNYTSLPNVATGTKSFILRRACEIARPCSQAGRTLNYIACAYRNVLSIVDNLRRRELFMRCSLFCSSGCRLRWPIIVGWEYGAPQMTRRLCSASL